MEKAAIVEYLQELNQELAALDVIGEVCLYGGAVMCLVYDARPSTKDVRWGVPTNATDAAGNCTGG